MKGRRVTGFSLIELVVVVLLTAILAATVPMLIATPMDHLVASEQRLVATQLAQQRMEQLLAERRSVGYNGVSTAADDLLMGGSSYHRSVTLSPTLGGACPEEMACQTATVTVAVDGTPRTTLSLLLVDY